MATPVWPVDRRQLCQPRTEVDREACHGEQPESPRTRAKSRRAICATGDSSSRRPATVQIRRFCGDIPSCPAAAHLQGGRIARSRRGDRGGTGDLGPCRPGPTPAESPRGSANLSVARRREPGGKPKGNRNRAVTAEGNNRRTPGEGKPEDGGRRKPRTAGKRATGGKPAGETGGREVRPQTTR